MTALELPADADGMNDDRAMWALEAVKAFQTRTGTDDGDALADLICDLRHLTDRYPEYGNLAAAIRRASYHYTAETSEGEDETDGADFFAGDDA